MIKKSLLILVTAVLVSITGFAQVTTSSVHGNVSDDTDQALPDASVVAVHTPTGTRYGSTTNFDGIVNLRNMRVGGPYTITISYVGYKTEEISDVFLTLGQAYNFTLKMQSDSQQLDEVVLTSTTDGVFSNDRTGAETSIGKEAIAILPTISRSVSDFTRIDPTASGNSFGGRNDQYNNFSLDGSIFNNPFGLDSPTPGGQTGANPISIDAIDQISVATAPYDVTQSGFTGASVNAVTKSGTNEFHGTVYGFFRNEDLTGGKIKGDDITKGDLEQKQYGFSVGGPLIKNKLFFFANFEKDERTDDGSFAFAPNTGTGAANETRVLETDLIAVQNALLNLGYDPGAYKGFTHLTESIKGIIKLDWNIDDNNRLAVIYNFLDASKEKPAHPTAFNTRGPNLNTLQFENAGYEINNELNSILFELNSNIGDNVTNKLQAGFTSFNDFRNPFSSPAPIINIFKNGSPYIIAGHEPFSINNKLKQKVYQFTDNLTYFTGSHAITMGISFEKFSFENSFNLAKYDNFSFPYRGTFTIPGFGGPYPSVQDFLDLSLPGGVTDTNIAFANTQFNSASAHQDGEVGGFNLYKANFGQMAFYLQDEWNATDNFKLTIGIRFDKPLYFDTSQLAQNFIDTQLESNPGFYDPTIEYFDPKNGNTVFFDNTQMPTNEVLFSPRFGFNWDIKGDHSFQVRGGTGIFTGRLPFVWLGNQIPGADAGFFQAVDPDFKWPQVWRTNVGVDYKFNNGFIASTDISYTKDLNGAHVQNWGLKTPSSNLSGVDNRPFYVAGDKNNNGYVFTNSDKGRIFNWTAKVEKRFESNLYFSIAYNYMDSQDVNSIEAEITGDAFTNNPALNNVNDPVLSHSKYGTDHRFIGVFSKIWNYGSNNRWGTTISSFIEYKQGSRFNYTYGGDINNDGSFVNDLIYIPTSSEVNQMNFVAPGQATDFENFINQDDYLSGRRGKYAERYGATSPWVGRIDLKLLQDFNFKISEKKQTIQFSIDIVNLGNLISSDWGLIQQPNSIQPIAVSVDPVSQVPTYSFDGNLTKTFGYDPSLNSRWQMQFGLRYIF